MGIFVGAYHYARPSIDTNLTGPFSADTEAAFFWSTASNYVKTGSTFLMPMLDWEDVYATNGYNNFNGFTAAFMSAWVNEWCNTVSNLAKASGVTVKPVVYTGTWYSAPSSSYPGLNSSVTGWADWISAYNGQNPQTGGPASSTPWSTWNFWQYAATNWSGGDSDVLKGVYTNLDPYVIGGLPATPYLLTQPVLQRAVDTGTNVTFSQTAGGNPPLKYQWIFNGTNILNATNSTLNLANVQPNNSGNYFLSVANAGGSVTSSPASLLVYPPQVTLFADNFDGNTSSNWIVNKSSSDNAVTFNFDYSSLGIPSAPHATNGTTRGVQLQANLTLGVVAALSISPTNQSFSGDYRLHFDGWINVNGPLPGGPGSTEFLTAGLGTSGTHPEWTGSGTADGFYFSADGDGGVSGTSTTAGDYSGYIGSVWQNAASGIYAAGIPDNAAVYYATAFPVGQAAPALQQSNYPQQTGTLASGTFGLAWHDVIVARRGNLVDWVIDGIRFATISNATFTASNVFVGFWDPFASLSSNNVINFGLVDNVRVEAPAIAPVISLQPQSQTVKLGTNVIFSAAANGLPAPNFQWQFNGTNIFGATNATLAFTFVNASNSGNYSVIASNIAGSVSSANAVLGLLPPVAAQFQNLSVDNSGALQINFSGDAYWNYTVQTSTNLIVWSALTNLTSASGQFSFTAGFATNAPQQFFRAIVGP